MRKLITILTLLTIHMTAFGQQEIGLKVNGGLSYLSTKVLSTETKVDKIYLAPSGQGGLFYNRCFRDKFLLGAELLYLQIEGKQYVEIPASGYNPTEIMVTNNIWRHISYLGIPIYIGYKLKKFNFNLGFQIGITLMSSGRVKGQAPGIPSWDNKSDNLGVDNYDYGARAGINFKLSDKFSIETNYYYGINNILKDQTGNLKWNVQQMTIGLRYSLFPIGGQKNETEK